MGSYPAVSPLSFTWLLPKGSTAVPPTRHQPLLSGGSSPVLPIGTVNPVPTVWEVPGLGHWWEASRSRRGC